MDIGSAKVTPEEMDGVPHYLIDVLDPRDSFNVVTFQQMAKEALREIYSHGRIPVIAGGTGFYIQALLYDIDFKENEDSSPVRRELEALAEREGERAPRAPSCHAPPGGPGGSRSNPCQQYKTCHPGH